MFTPKSGTLLPLVLLAAASMSSAEKLVPAGSLIQCTVSENKLSSKTVAIGDPILCQVSRSSVFTSGTVLSGRFEDYKDPGHLVGMGWMELVFDRMIFPSNLIVPVNSKVVAVPHSKVDLEGKILGKGHDTRDAIEWLIPVLWPIDLINLPRRGPRPTLKNESRITIKVMDDLVVPDMAPTQHNQYGFAQRAEAVSQEQEPQTSRVYGPERYPFELIPIKGGLIFATTYRYYGDQVQYVTPQGELGSINQDEIDINITIATNRRDQHNFVPPAGFRPNGAPLVQDTCPTFSPLSVCHTTQYDREHGGDQQNPEHYGYLGGGRR